MQPGDRIVEIDGENAIGIDPDDVPTKLKGPRGTTVDLVVQRPGNRGRLPYTITRDRIPLNTVNGHLHGGRDDGPDRAPAASRGRATRRSATASASCRRRAWSG